MRISRRWHRGWKEDHIHEAARQRGGGGDDAGETLYLIYVTWREKRGSFRGDQGKDRLMVPNYRTTELAPPHAEWNLVIPLT